MGQGQPCSRDEKRELKKCRILCTHTTPHQLVKQTLFCVPIILTILIDNFPNCSTSKQHHKNHQHSLIWHSMQTALQLVEAPIIRGNTTAVY